MTKISLLKIAIGASIAAGLYSIGQMMVTLGSNPFRTKLFMIILFLSAATGIVLAVMLRYTQSATVERDYEKIAMETLAKIGADKKYQK